MAATYITFSSLLHSLNSSKSLSSKEYQPNVVNLNLRNALGKPQRKLSLTFCQPKKVKESWRVRLFKRLIISIIVLSISILFMFQQAESFESLYTDELNMRKMLEEELKKQKEELVSMISQRDSLNEELQRALDLEKSIDSQVNLRSMKLRYVR
jgi:DNA-binding helix-hairpin-helix protein with protein kinase domain